jgi:hypothetical protein
MDELENGKVEGKKIIMLGKRNAENMNIFHSEPEKSSKGLYR